MRISHHNPIVRADLDQAKAAVTTAAEFVANAAIGGVVLAPEARLFDQGSSTASNILGGILYVPNLAASILLGAVALGAAGVWASRAGVEALRHPDAK